MTSSLLEFSMLAAYGPAPRAVITVYFWPGFDALVPQNVHSLSSSFLSPYTLPFNVRVGFLSLESLVHWLWGPKSLGVGTLDPPPHPPPHSTSKFTNATPSIASRASYSYFTF
ncbi:hypothetical protein VNO77_04945 [Canavalia gladiata]|uniref:Uncharacterized protein n=1 Tax=Canavalia gladiata TaxID=3824 RepID=A0AAN9MY55_CANGL